MRNFTTTRLTTSFCGVVEKIGVLMGAHEIRIRLGGVSRQRVYQLTSRADFPAPVADLAQGKVWRAADVDAWMAVHRPG
jgi:prophage regulatory protein